MEEPILRSAALHAARAWRAIASAFVVAGIAAGCAAPAQPLPDPPPERPATRASTPGTDSPVFQAPSASPARPDDGRPADAATLPPFQGDSVAFGRAQRGQGGIDRTRPADDLWQRIRDGFGMPDLESPIVQERVAWYVARPEYLKRVFERSRRYLYHIVEELERRGMPTELALLPMVESSFNPMALSPARASGLWQFIPGTGKRYDLTQNWWYDGRRDIVASTSAALDYLKDIYELHGDWQLALASYNWGENAVARAIEKNRAAGLPTDYSSLTMPLETRHYVPKLQALKNIIARPDSLGITLDPIPNQPYFTEVNRSVSLDVRLAAKLAELPLDEFLALNPGFNRPLMPANVGTRLVLPADKVDVFHANLQKLDDKQLVSWQSYHPKPGEKLDAIAKRFGITVAQLRQVNGITGANRQVPNPLVVPVKGATIDLGSLPAMYAPPVPAPARRARIHTVARGETLQGIAQRYDVTVDDLRRWNRIGRLVPGQKLSIELRAAPNAQRSAPAPRNRAAAGKAGRAGSAKAPPKSKRKAPAKPKKQ